jgi:hypothetical protein
MLAELAVAVVVETLDGDAFDGVVHPLDPTAGPGGLGLGRALLGVVPGSGELEGMSPEGARVGDGFLDQRNGPAAGAARVNWMPLYRLRR